MVEGTISDMEVTIIANTPIEGELVPVGYTLSDVLSTDDTQLQHLNGKPFNLLRVIDQPDDRHDFEVLPMFEIEIEGDTLEVFSDEITKLRRL